MLAFVHIQKAAGTTLKWMQRSTYGLRHLDVEPWHAQFAREPFSPDDLRRLFRYFPYLVSIHGHRVVPYAGLEQVAPNIKYLTFLRDPLKQCASWFQHLVETRNMKDLVFEEFIQAPFPRNRQTQMLAGNEDVNAAIHVLHEKSLFVGLVERFDESTLMLKRLLVPDLNIGYVRKGVARRNEIAQQLLSDPRTRRMIVEATLSDQELYDYVRQEVYPAYCRAYGSGLPDDVAAYQKSNGDFNKVRATLSRLQLYGAYKPLLYLYRRGLRL